MDRYFYRTKCNTKPVPILVHTMLLILHYMRQKYIEEESENPIDEEFLE